MDREAENELQELTALLDFEGSPQKTTISKCLSPAVNTVANEETKDMHNKPKPIRDFNMFDKENDTSDTDVPKLPSLSQIFSKSTDVSKHEKSEIHNGDTDSSDEEDNKNTTEQKYTDNGREIKNLIKKQNSNTPYNSSNNSSWKTNKSLFAPSGTTTTSGATQSRDVYTDPYFGIRIITPLISSQLLKERMAGKTPVVFNKLQSHISSNIEKSNDWVMAGVVVSKSVKTSQKGTKYVSWTLSDLRDDLKTVSLMLFGKAYQKLWKTNTHTVVAILNPTPLDSRKTSRDIAALSVNNPDQVMIWGTSKDLGTCKSRKKNGEPCTAIVNINQCEYCIYHLKQEHRKFTSRSELQAPSGGGLTQLKNKVLGKNEVFYAGRSYTAVVAKPAKKQVAKDQKRLKDLFSQCDSRLGPETAPARMAMQTPSARVQLMKDAERLQKLTGSPATINTLTLEGRGEKDKFSKSLLSKDFKTGEKTNKRKADDLEIPPSKKLQTHCNSLTKPTEVQKENKRLGKSNFDNQSEKFSERIKSQGVCKLSLKNNGSHKVLSNGVSKIIGTTNKTLPTKNRFQNLTKIKSIHSKTSETEFKNHTTKSNCDQPQALIDVCFEFDDMTTSKKTQLENNVVSSENLPKAVRSSTTWQSKSESLIESISTINNKNPLKPVHTQPDSTTAPALVSPNFVRQSRAKHNALKYVRAKGPIMKEDRNGRKNNETSETVKKQNKTCLEKQQEETSKTELKLIGNKASLSKRFVELMNAESKHTDLITNAENKELDEYYDKMEKKEKMEEKMLNTYKKDCKAVRCLKCNYKQLSASDLCKKEKHPLKIISAVMRYFQCQNCKKRTTTLDIIPVHNCYGCGLSSWIKVPMLQERNSSIVRLSIRGGEQKFTNSVVADANLDLLVPDDDV